MAYYVKVLYMSKSTYYNQHFARRHDLSAAICIDIDLRLEMMVTSSSIIIDNVDAQVNSNDKLFAKDFECICIMTLTFDLKG